MVPSFKISRRSKVKGQYPSVAPFDCDVCFSLLSITDVRLKNKRAGGFPPALQLIG
jgi:hypothetical protein